VISLKGRSLKEKHPKEKQPKEKPIKVLTTYNQTTMKRITLLMLMLATVVVYAQKPVKPNLNKIPTLWKEGKLAEAKEMVDAATTYEKTMNDGKTYYYRGLVYAMLDTTSNESFKSLAQDPLTVAIESFKKADELDKKNSGYFIQDGVSIQTKEQQEEALANYYLNKGITEIQSDEPNYDKVIAVLDKGIKVFESLVPKYANDTLTYYVQGLAASNGEKHDMAIESLGKYFAKGGKSKDAYILLYQVYSGPKENKEKALEVVREGKAKNGHSDFSRLEIGLLIDLNRIGEAKDGLEAAVAKNPNDKILHFYLAYANSQLKNIDAAKKHYLEALRIDPAYFEAQYYYAQLFLLPVEDLTKQINSLGISAKDAQKKRELYQERVKKSEEAIPQLEKAEGMKANDNEARIDVLEKLKLLYYYTADDAKSKVVTQKLKILGVSED
jgi:predicted Zn-dependent protease